MLIFLSPKSLIIFLWLFFIICVNMCVTHMQTVLDSCSVCPYPSIAYEKICLSVSTAIVTSLYLIFLFFILFYMYVINYIKCLVSVLCVHEESFTHDKLISHSVTECCQENFTAGFCIISLWNYVHL